MDTAQIVDKLNEILKWEWAGLVQYTQHSFLVQDLWRAVYGTTFRANGKEALDHAHQVGDKIVALGGVPTVERAEVKQSTDLIEMLEYDLELERTQAALYGEALALVGDSDIPLRLLLEEIMAEEQQGVEQLEKILKKKDLAVGVKGKRSQRAG